MADVSKLQIGSETYNISDSTARQKASQASQAASTAQQAASEASQAASAAQQTASNASQAASAAQETANNAGDVANDAKTLALKGFSVKFTSPDTITFTQITEG